MKRRPAIVAAACAIALASVSAARAEVPRVATDIAPVHALAAQVLGDLGAPDLILAPGTSPHGYAMRPSEARAVATADLVFWVGPGLTPWLERPLENLAGGATVVELAAVPGTSRLEFREGASFGSHDHDDDDGHDAEHDPETRDAHGDEHDDHDHHHEHEESADHADHEVEEHAGDGDGHDHNGLDPHSWLDPRNGQAWLAAMAEAMSEADPENAATYAANAEAASVELAALEQELAEALAPVGDLNFVVFHDAYHYFEARFGLHAAGAISLADASDPSAARIREVQHLVDDLAVECIAAEPQFNPALVTTVAEGSGAVTTVLDPMGMDLEPGPAFYAELLRELAAGFLACR